MNNAGQAGCRLDVAAAFFRFWRSACRSPGALSRVGLGAGLGLASLLAACNPQTRLASARNPDLFEKAGDALYGRGTPPPVAAPPEMFVRQRNLNVERVEKPNETGSLFNPEDDRNFLFTTAAPLKVGRFLSIKLVDNRKKPGTESETNAAAAAKSTPSSDQVEEALLKALPDFEPAKKAETVLLDSIKMKIAHRYPNGDVLATLSRQSETDEQVAQTDVQARIPYDRLITGEPLTTDDLLDVKLTESRDGEVAERRSSGWEDEYSLRLSGFSEAKSKAALALDDKKRQLEQATENLRDRIKAMGAERRQLAKQREENQLKAAKDAKRIEEIEQTLSDKDKMIGDQKSTIDSQTTTIEEQQKALEEISKAGDKGGAAGA